MASQGACIIIHPIIILGAGPAGIATAVEAINKGYSPNNIIILEKSAKISYMISAKYPEEKPVLANYKGRIAECIGDMCINDMSKEEFLNYLNQIIFEKKIQIQFNQDVTKITKLKNSQFRVETKTDTFLSDTVFIAIGNMSAPRTLGIAMNKDVIPFIHYDIQSIERDNEKVLVIGGGDSAGEYVHILQERGHTVTLSYRGSHLTKMNERNLFKIKSLIETQKVFFLPASNIKSLEVINNQIKVIFQEDNILNISVGAIVTALGAERPVNYLRAIGIDMEFEEQDSYAESKMTGLFLVGDLASGSLGGSINLAFNSGVKAIQEACYFYLDCK